MYRLPDSLDDNLKDLLFETSPDAQDIRRNLLQGANVLLVGGGPTRNLFLYKRIKQLGANLYVTDAPGSIWADPALQFLMSGFVAFDFGDLDNMSNRFVDAVNAERDNLPPRFDAVLTFDDAHLLAAPAVASALRVPFQPESAVRASRHKTAMRETLAAAGIPGPRFRAVDSEAAVRDAVAAFGTPVVVKPAGGAHSAAVQRADDADAAVAAFWYARDLMRPDDDLLWRLAGTDVLIEEYLDGPELDVHVLLSGGEAVYARALDHWPTAAPWFEQHGFDCPSVADRHVQDGAIAHVTRCLHALEFANGAFHAEVRVTETGPRLVEINARIGGGPLYFLHRVTWGVDLVEELCYIAMGLPSRPVAAQAPRRHCMASYFPTPRSGIVNADGWLEWAREFDDRVVTLVEFFRDGEEVLGRTDGIPDNLGHVMVAAESRDECFQVLKGIFERVEVPVEGEGGETGGRFELMAPAGITL